MSEARSRPLCVALVLGARFDDLDFFPLFTMLTKAADYVQLRVETWSSQTLATSKCGFGVPCKQVDAPAEGFDVVAVPGAADFSALVASPTLRGLLVDHMAHGRPVYTVCSGVDLLTQSGLIAGFTVCAHGRLAGTTGYVTYTDSGIERDRWLTSIGGDGSNRYSKSIECFFRILEDHFPHARNAIVARTEIDSVFAAAPARSALEMQMRK